MNTEGNTYPRVKYHIRGGGTILVADAAQEKALGSDWVDHKALSPNPPRPAAPETPKKRGRPPRVTDART